jgi:hypothetical protein
MDIQAYQPIRMGCAITWNTQEKLFKSILSLTIDNSTSAYIAHLLLYQSIKNPSIPWMDSPTSPSWISIWASCSFDLMCTGRIVAPSIYHSVKPVISAYLWASLYHQIFIKIKCHLSLPKKKSLSISKIFVSSPNDLFTIIVTSFLKSFMLTISKQCTSLW